MFLSAPAARGKQKSKPRGQISSPGYEKAPPLVSKRRGVLLATSYFRTTYRCTIIGAAAFHFRVRNGNGWDHCARITRSLTNLKLNSASSSGGEGEDRNRTSNSPDFYRPWRCQVLIGASHRGALTTLVDALRRYYFFKSKNRADSLTSTYRQIFELLRLSFKSHFFVPRHP